MATIVTRRAVTPSPRSTVKSEWLDGRARRFVRGDDFDCRPEEFGRRFRRAAQKAGKTGHGLIIDDETVEAWVD